MELGIGERPSSSTPRRPRTSRSRGAKTVGIITKADLFKLRGLVFWRYHTDEIRDGRTVVVKRGFATVARLECATEQLAWDAERLLAGIRFRRGAE
jgi:hypothetical protein